jgi:hypothetical protein
MVKICTNIFIVNVLTDYNFAALKYFAHAYSDIILLYTI